MRDMELEDRIRTAAQHAAPGSPESVLSMCDALQAAMAIAGVTREDVGKQKVKLDKKKGHLIYKVKMKTNKGKCKYSLDASSGEMVRCKKDPNKGKKGKKKMSKKKKKAKKKYVNASYYGTGYGTGTAANTAGAYGAAGTAVVVPEGAIGDTAAKEAALAHAGISAAQTKYVNCNPQIGHGPDHYDVKFVAGPMKYKYAIGLYDGAVLGRAVKNKAAKGKYVYEGNYHEHFAPLGPGMTAAAASAPAARETAAPVPPAAPEAPEAAPIPPVAPEAAPIPPVTPEAPEAAPVTPETPVEAPVPPVLPVMQQAYSDMVSEQDALAIALREACLTKNELIRWKVKMKTKHGCLLYRFKLKIPGCEHEIDVDAYTGNVMKHHEEVDY